MDRAVSSRSMNWDKVREWIQALLMPAAVAAAGYWVAKSNATREVDARMIEIAAQILAGPVSDSTRLLREWAAKELARHSDVPFSAGAESTLVQLGPGVFAIVPARQFGGLLLCDSVGHKCRPVFEKPLPVTSGPPNAVISVQPQTATLLAGDSIQLSAAITSDRPVPTAVRWTASGGGRITQAGVFTADTIPGDFAVTASVPEWGLASTARVHVVRHH